MTTDKYASYLGDAVYANYDGYHLVLTTSSHLPLEARDTIMLDPEVTQALLQYIERLKEQLRTENATPCPLNPPDQLQ